jgi:hypothetical protein
MPYPLCEGQGEHSQIEGQHQEPIGHTHRWDIFWDTKAERGREQDRYCLNLVTSGNKCIRSKSLTANRFHIQSSDYHAGYEHGSIAKKQTD